MAMVYGQVPKEKGGTQEMREFMQYLTKIFSMKDGVMAIANFICIEDEPERVQLTSDHPSRKDKHFQIANKTHLKCFQLLGFFMEEQIRRHNSNDVTEYLCRLSLFFLLLGRSLYGVTNPLLFQKIKNDLQQASEKNNQEEITHLRKLRYDLFQLKRVKWQYLSDQIPRIYSKELSEKSNMQKHTSSDNMSQLLNGMFQDTDKTITLANGRQEKSNKYFGHNFTYGTKYSNNPFARCKMGPSSTEEEEECDPEQVKALSSASGKCKPEPNQPGPKKKPCSGMDQSDDEDVHEV